MNKANRARLASPTRMVTFIALFAITISGIGVDLLAPSLPAISTFFQVPDAYAKMTIGIYFVGFGIGQFLFGIPSDSYGRKPMLIIGTILFFIASMLAPFSHNMAILLVLRGVQGIGAASCSAISKTLFADILTGKKLAIALSYLSVVWGMGPIVAPLIGGYLQFYFDWQANFYFFSAFSGILLLTVVFFLKETHLEPTPFRPKVFAKKIKKVLSHHSYVGAIIALGIGYGMIVVFNVVGPFLIQNVLGYNAAVYGHVALFVAIAYFLGSIINRILLSRLSLRTIVRIGLLISLIASSAFVFISYEFRMNLYNFSIPFCVILFGIGLVSPNLMAKCMMLFPQSRGIASAIMGTAFSIIAAISSVTVGFLKGNSPIPVAWAMLTFALINLGVYWFMISNADEEGNAI